MAITDTKYALLFSAALLILALALAVFGRMVSGRWVLRLSLLAGAGAALGSIANVVEDGLDILQNRPFSHKPCSRSHE